MHLFQQVLRRTDGPKLPPSSIAKLEAMREALAAASARTRDISSKLRDSIKVRSGIEKEKGELTGEWAMGHLQRRVADPRGGGHMATNGRETLAEIDQALEQQNAEIAALRKKEAAAQAASEVSAGPLQAIETWLDEHAGADFQPVDGAPNLKRKAGEDWAATVKRLRAELAELQAERHRVASAPIPAAEAKAAIRREVEELANAGAPDVGACLERGAVRWPVRPQEQVGWNTARGGDFDTRRLIIWLMRDELIGRLEAEIDALADDSEALTDVERAKEDARLRAEVLRVEREEEAAIVAAAEEGTTVPRRSDADPRAVLELADNVGGYGG